MQRLNTASLCYVGKGKITFDMEGQRQTLPAGGQAFVEDDAILIAGDISTLLQVLKNSSYHLSGGTDSIGYLPVSQTFDYQTALLFHCHF
jgi:hypothetical protein